MKLFIFEGAKREPKIFSTLERLFFTESDSDQRIVCCYNSNIYSLYQHYITYNEGADIVSVLREVMKGRDDNPLTEDMLASDFGEIYLFFDYDFHENCFTLEEINQHLVEMLQVFNNETENGKLYISYPMIEALRYTKCLPDNDYINYVVSRQQSHDFKQIASDFSYYRDGWDFIVINKGDSPERYDSIRNNWVLLIRQNVNKANWLCNATASLPIKIDNICPLKVFQAQLSKYVTPREMVSVLSGFALFLYDYFGRGIVEDI